MSSIPELVFSDQDLAELETMKSKLEATRASQRAMTRAEAPELGEEELDVEGLEN
jgi:hypothetical protein